MICREMSSINWNDLVFNLNVNATSIVFTDTFLNIISKCVANKIVTCTSRDTPWVFPSINTAIKRNAVVYRAVFLDISKAFDKVWHDGIVYKLKCNGISGNLLKLLDISSSMRLFADGFSQFTCVNGIGETRANIIDGFKKQLGISMENDL